MGIYPIGTSPIEGPLKIGGIDSEALANEWGTPLYVLDAATIQEKCQAYTDSLKKHYPKSRVLYASKANANTGLFQFLAKQGLGFDVVSAGELATAFAAGISPDNIYFHGNNKSIHELQMAVKNRIRIIVDNHSELAHLVQISKSETLAPRVLFRANPGIEAHTHDAIRTGHIDSKFGIAKEDLADFVKLAIANRFEVLGLHSHVGSQIFDIAPYIDLVDVMLDHMAAMQKITGKPLPELSLGGGLGVQYIQSDDPPAIESLIQKIAEALHLGCEKRDLELPLLCLEPGRSIIAEAGVTLYRVGAVKTTPTEKTYLFIDGGMADNPRPLMYGSTYTILNASRPHQAPTRHYAIAGKFCESGDILAENVALPETQENDLIVFFGTGAYHYSMASNYNRIPRPAMILIENGIAKCLVKRESIDDLLQFDQKLEQ